jgi:putative ATPase
MNKPLAIDLQPKSLKDVLGQEHLIGKDKVLTNLVKNKHLFSMILYGLPGIGKTSIAMALINDLDERYRLFNATRNNKKDLEIIIEEGKMYGGIILVLDEIHRLNKDKQDILLPEIECGNVILIGMTTENPYHSTNPAIRSRCQLFELHPLSDKDIIKGIKRAINSEFLKGIDISTKAIEMIAKIAGNDLRSAYNLLEVAYYSTKDHKIDEELIKSINSKPVFFSDKNGDAHYDVLSGLQKSIRGSDVDASLHYAARLVMEGDLESLFRRLSVIAYEDIGLASPSIGLKVVASIQASERIGYPELIKPLSVAVIDMALSPKSNSADSAINKAIEDINTGNVGRIPNNIKTTSPNYKYPHNYPNYYVEQQYMPDKLIGRKYYTPRKNKYETELYNFNQKLRGQK